MFHHAYDGYLKYAYPYDELRPLTCDGVDTWGSYSLTLIDALDTLAVMGNYTEFKRVYHLITTERVNFDSNINVSVFETNIRIVGGLLSAHLLAKRAGVDVEPGWPCNGPLLRLAEDAATRLLPAFDTKTGMPYGTVNLRHGVPKGETPVTCTAAVGTYIVEFGALSRLTGNPLFEETALRALRALWNHRSSIGLFGNHIDVESGKWTATDAGIGAGVDSYYEYLVKGSALLQRPELMHMFKEGRVAVEQYLNHDDWYFWATMKQGAVTMPVFQSLEAFWPGLLSLTGDTTSALKTIHNYHQVWKQYGFLPEFYNVAQNGAVIKREGYPLRPELIESAMYLYRATKDPFLLSLGEDMLRSIQHTAKTECGYATVKDVKNHLIEDRMESFFLAETTKYLYLLFDIDNFVHNDGNVASVIKTPHGECIVDAGGYVFNTEAHLIDPAALQCCSSHTIDEIRDHIAANTKDIVLNPEKFNEFIGDTIPARLQQIEAERQREAERRRIEREEYQRRMMEQRAKQREHIKKKNESKMRQTLLQLENVTIEDKNISLNSTSHMEKLELDFSAELKPLEVDESEPAFSKAEEKDVAEESPDDLLIQRQSKDETVVSSIQGPPAEKEDDGTDPNPTSFLEKFTGIWESYLMPNKEFDLDKFAAKVLSSNNNPINETWSMDHSILSCPAKHFLERFTIQGEYFDAYS